MDRNITQVAMTVYLSFSVIFFTVCIFNEWPVWQYLVLFLVFAFVMQFSINMWASAKVCPLGNSNNVSIEKALGYTVVPWFLILVVISFILYIMPGWVRVFSNTLGLAVAKSVYYELFTVDDPNKPGKAEPGKIEPGKAEPGKAEPGNGKGPPPYSEAIKLGEKKMGGSGTEKVPEQTNLPVNPDAVPIPSYVISEIYHDPSKMINEIEYLPDFNEWYEKIFTKYLILLPYFNNPKFFDTKTVYKVVGGGPEPPGGTQTPGGPEPPGGPQPPGGPDIPETTGKPKERPVNETNNIYKLYKCVATKEKIGYFTWLFLSGAIFTLTSLSQMYSSDC